MPAAEARGIPAPITLTGDPATVDAIAALEAASFSIPWSKDAFKASFDNEFVEISGIYEDGELVAYAVLFTLFETSDLQDIAVREDLRGKGYGKALLSDCVARAAARGADRVCLEVREGNAPARALYEHNGFRQFGRRKNYYAYPPEDALLYQRILKE